MRLSHNSGKTYTDKENNMADFIGPKEKLTVAQAAARRKKLQLAQREAQQADLAKAKAGAPVPKAEVRAAKAAAQAATKAKVVKAVTRVAKFATKKSVIGTVALAAGGALASKLNKDASKGKPATGNQNVTTGRGGRPQGFIKDKPKGPSFSTASKPPISKEKPKDKIPSGKYRVETGDTLSGIAKKAGVTLAELRSANPQIKDPRKIFRNTGVTIPKGKTAAGGYTGPVPYRPGSKAAADYEASRKKK
jgi:LysM repeat protein